MTQRPLSWDERYACALAGHTFAVVGDVKACSTCGQPNDHYPDRQDYEWQLHWDAAIAEGRCPHSGELIVICQSWLCDCFDVPSPRMDTA